MPLGCPPPPIPPNGAELRPVRPAIRARLGAHNRLRWPIAINVEQHFAFAMFLLICSVMEEAWESTNGWATAFASKGLVKSLFGDGRHDMQSLRPVVLTKGW